MAERRGRGPVGGSPEPDEGGNGRDGRRGSSRFRARLLSTHTATAISGMTHLTHSILSLSSDRVLVQEQCRSQNAKCRMKAEGQMSKDHNSTFSIPVLDFFRYSAFCSSRFVHRRPDHCAPC